MTKTGRPARQCRSRTDRAAFAELAADLAPVYHRRDLRANGLLYLRGLLMPQAAGNCWSIAEAVGLDRPCRLHHLLDRACWDEDAARDAVRAFLTRHLGADFYAYAPEGHACSLTDLVKIVGTRWKVEDDFQDSKSTVSLDQTQVRLYCAWKRHVTLAMAALAFLAVIAAIERGPGDGATRPALAGTTTAPASSSSHDATSHHDLRLEY